MRRSHVWTPRSYPFSRAGTAFFSGSRMGRRVVTSVIQRGKLSSHVSTTVFFPLRRFLRSTLTTAAPVFSRWLVKTIDQTKVRAPTPDPLTTVHLTDVPANCPRATPVTAPHFAVQRPPAGAATTFYLGGPAIPRSSIIAAFRHRHREVPRWPPVFGLVL